MNVTQTTPTPATPPVTLDQIKARAVECGKEITSLQIKGQGVDLKIARLMVEAMDGKYAQANGLAKFEDWLEKYTTLGKPSNAFGLMRIVRGADCVGVRDEILEQIPVIKLKHIFGLDGTTNAADIKKLLTKCKNKGSKFTHEQVKVECDRIKAGGKLDDNGDAAAADGEAAPELAPMVKTTFTLSAADNAILQNALKATNQKDTNVALLTLANAYMLFLQAPPAPMTLAKAA